MFLGQGRTPEADGDNVMSKSKSEKILLAEIDVPEYKLRLELCRDQLECRGSIEISEAKKGPGYERLLAILAEHGVKKRLREAELQLFCAKAARGDKQADVLLAEGIAPVEGVPGRLDFSIRTADADAEFWEVEDGCVDLRTRHTFSNIAPGQVVGTIQPPGEGEPGETAHGCVIPPVRGRPLVLKCGAGVRIAEDGRTVIATEHGRVIYEKEKIFVSDEMIINGDLDLEVGNIDFSGFVEVRGDVLDDFSIRALKGIKIRGAVGACALESDGSIEIGSMSGLGRGTVVCGGDFSAHHVIEATVECRGHVKIAAEVRNSVIRAGGRISLEKGAALGGNLMALEGIEVRQLGSSVGVETVVAAGVYFPEEDEALKDRAEIASLEQKIQRIDATTGPLGAVLHSKETLSDAVSMRIRVLQKQRKKLEDLIEAKLLEQTRKKRDAHPGANAKINVSQVIHEGVTVFLGESSFCFSDRHLGATSLIENTYSGGIRTLPLSSLKIPAEKLEVQAWKEDRLAAEEAAAQENDDDPDGERTAEKG